VLGAIWIGGAIFAGDAFHTGLDAVPYLLFAASVIVVGVAGATVSYTEGRYLPLSGESASRSSMADAETPTLSGAARRCTAPFDKKRPPRSGSALLLVVVDREKSLARTLTATGPRRVGSGCRCFCAQRGCA
jgi:hypothetical protein